MWFKWYLAGLLTIRALVKIGRSTPLQVPPRWVVAVFALLEALTIGGLFWFFK